MFDDRRGVLYLLLAATALLWISLRAIPAVASGVGEIEARIDAQVQALHLAHRRVALLPLLADSVDRLEESVADIETHVLPGGVQDAVESEVVRRSIFAVDPERSIVEYARPISPDSVPEGAIPFQRVHVELSLVTDYLGVLDTLEAIESDPGLWVESVRIVGRDIEIPSGELLRVLDVVIRVGAWYA